MEGLEFSTIFVPMAQGMTRDFNEG
jgi:hypothetical protein